jgi:hypothetical protein
MWAGRYVKPPFKDMFMLINDEWCVYTEVGYLRAEDVGWTKTPEEREAQFELGCLLAHPDRFHSARAADRTLDECSTCGHLVPMSQGPFRSSGFV